MKHILLTGATGFLGSHLLEALLTQGYKVTILKRSTSDTWRIDHLLNNVSVHDNNESLELVFEGKDIDTVIHLATCYRKFEDASDIEEMTKANIAFPSEVLIQGIKHGLKHFINTGSYFEYDCSVQPVVEDASLKPFNYYASTKIAFDSILKSYRKKLKVSTMRLFSPYGERDNNKLIPMLIKKALNGERVDLSEGFQKIDPVYAADIVDAYLKCLDSDNYTGYEAFNIGSGQAYSIRDIVSVIEEQLGRKMNIAWGDRSANDYECVYADINKARDILNWKPAHTLKKGIAKTIEYYRGEI
jgi:nucleoside-diphosphate-sugar epimerase